MARHNSELCNKFILLVILYILGYDNLLGNPPPKILLLFFIFLLRLFAAAIQPCIEISPPNCKARLFEGIEFLRLNLYLGISMGLKSFVEISKFNINKVLLIKY